MITLSWWVFAGALCMAALLGGFVIAALMALAERAPEAPHIEDDEDWQP